MPVIFDDGSTYFTRAPVKVRIVNAGYRGNERRVEVLDFLGLEEHYSASFGLQWTKFRDIQIDRFNGTRGSYKHLRSFVQQDLSVLNDAVCLEIGSGCGRFTDYLVDLCKVVLTVDPSTAIFANVALGAPNLIPCRADLFDIPIRREEIDVVFCRGVIQHTENPRRAIGRLFECVRPGGVVLFDVYPLKWYTPFVTKYWLRPFTRRMDPRRFTRWAETWVPRLLRFKSKIVNRLLPNNPIGVNLSNQLVPIADFTRSADLTLWEQQVRWSILDTVDMYTAHYDKPMTYKAILRTLSGVGALEIQGNPSSFCFKAMAPQRREE